MNEPEDAHIRREATSVPPRYTAGRGPLAGPSLYRRSTSCVVVGGVLVQLAGASLFHSSKPSTLHLKQTLRLGSLSPLVAVEGHVQLSADDLRVGDHPAGRLVNGADGLGDWGGWGEWLGQVLASEVTLLVILPIAWAVITGG